MIDTARDNMVQRTNEAGKHQRMYKDRIFRMIFSDKKELLSLYNAMNGTHYTDPDELENAIYRSMRNDLSFLLDSHPQECIKNDILAEFLRNHRAEARNVSIFEYDEELHMRQVREEGRVEGRTSLLMALILKSIQAKASITNEELAAEYQIGYEEVEEIRKTLKQ